MSHKKSLVTLIKRLSMTCGLVMALAATSVSQDLAGIKCVINGDKPASADSSVDYLDAKVYFCCDDCAAAFKADMDKTDSPVLIKANHQLLLTGQYVQKACPLTGKPVAADKSVDVGGVQVGLCCGGCVAKVTGAADLAAKANLCFVKASFEKGFELKKAEPNLENVKCMLMPAKPVSKDFAAPYGDHQVFFCCKGCKAKFEKDATPFAAKANHQLFQTGQVEQIACPFSGSATKDEHATEVNGVTVKFCCANCKAKTEAAEAGQRVDLVFGEKGFAKGFK